jgi:aspartate/methionine/tyrosine aminotransferase
MKMSRIIGFVVTFGIMCIMFLAFSSSNKQVENMIKNDPQYQAHREMLKAAGVNPDDPKAVEAYMKKMAEDIKQSQEIPAGVAKE